MRSLTAEQVIWHSRGSSSIVEVAVSLAAFVEVLRGAGQGEWGDGRSNCSAAACGGITRVRRIDLRPSCEYQQVPMNGGELARFRFALRGRGVQQE
jgi:hypothetical protein